MKGFHKKDIDAGLVFPPLKFFKRKKKAQKTCTHASLWLDDHHQVLDRNSSKEPPLDNDPSLDLNSGKDPPLDHDSGKEGSTIRS